MDETQDFQSIKPFIYENYQQYRILQPNVIFIHGLPEKLTNYQQLEKNLQVYGKINKLSIQFLSKNFYSCFVHFQNSISACLAIAALDNFYIDKRILKVSFASTKFCPNFLRGIHCYLQNCNYAHYYIAQFAHLKDFAKQINHKVISWNKIWQNYSQILLFLFKNQSHSNIFPSGLSKFHDILFFKSSQINQFQKRIQQGLTILQQKLKKKKSMTKMRCSQQKIKIQPENQENQDQWINIDDSISDFVQDSQINDKKSKNKTKIQQFLQQTDQQLMSLIFKLQMQQYVY